MWTSGQPLARAVTSDHSSVFAGWQGGHLLVSRVVDGVPGTYKVDPTPGAALGDRVSDGWRPAVAPDGRSAVWWDGDVKLAADGVSLVPAGGRLVLGPWGSGDGTRQVLAEGKVKDWEIRWAPDGSVLAVWLAGERARDPGSLSLYRIDGDTGRARLGKPMLEDEPAMDGFSLESGRLAFPVRADGKTVIRILAWAGDEMGWSELPAEAGTTVVRNP